MLDEQDRDAAPVANGADFLAERIDLLVIEPGGRLVEQKQLRPDRERAGELDPLAHAERQFADRPVGDALRARIPRSARPPARRAAAPRAPREASASALARKPPRAKRMRADPHVVARRHGREQRDVLEGARDAERGDLVPRHARKRPAVEPDRAGVRLVEAGDAVEQRRLAGAVRADQAADRAGRDREADVVERGDAAEADRTFVDRQQRGSSVDRRSAVVALASASSMDFPFPSNSPVSTPTLADQDRRFGRDCHAAFSREPGAVQARLSRNASTPAL